MKWKERDKADEVDGRRQKKSDTIGNKNITKRRKWEKKYVKRKLKS